MKTKYKVLVAIIVVVVVILALYYLVVTPNFVVVDKDYQSNASQTQLTLRLKIYNRGLLGSWGKIHVRYTETETFTGTQRTETKESLLHLNGFESEMIDLTFDRKSREAITPRFDWWFTYGTVQLD
jgi:hypothetical protein